MKQACKIAKLSNTVIYTLLAYWKFSEQKLCHQIAADLLGKMFALLFIRKCWHIAAAFLSCLMWRRPLGQKR